MEEAPGLQGGEGGIYADYEQDLPCWSSLPPPLLLGRSLPAAGFSLRVEDL